MMWLVIMTIASLACAFKQSLMRIHGFSWWMVATLLGLFVIIEGGYWLGMQLSKQAGVSFFQVWFIVSAILALLGVSASLLYFKEPLTYSGVVGAALIVAGSAFLLR